MKLPQIKNKFTGYKLESTKIHIGAINCLNGPSGSGKTTILRDIIKSEDFKNMIISYVPQKPVIFPETALFNVIFFRNISLDEVDPLLEVVGFDKNKLDVKLAEDGYPFSGGELKRLFLLRALISKPQLLILDETFSEIDAHTSKNIINHIKIKKITTLMTTHSEELRNYADFHLNLEK